MNRDTLSKVAQGQLSPLLLEEPFVIIAESCMSPYIPHELHWEYFFSSGTSLYQSPSEEISISEITARKLIELYNLNTVIQTSDKILYQLSNSSKVQQN